MTPAGKEETAGGAALPRRDDQRARGQVADPLVALRREDDHSRGQPAEEQRVGLHQPEQRPDERSAPAAPQPVGADDGEPLEVLARGARPERLKEEEVDEVGEA